MLGSPPTPPDISEGSRPAAPQSTAAGDTPSTTARTDGRRALSWLPRVSWGTLVVTAGALALIQVASLFLPDYIFPDLPKVVTGLGEVLVDEGDDILKSVARFLVALLAAIVCGWALGLAMGAFRRTLGGVLSPALNILMAMPALSWILVSVLWISSIETRIVFICFVIGMPFFAVAVFEGIRDIDPAVVKAIEQFRPTRLQVIRILLIPQSLVFLLLSVRSTSSLCLRILVFAEMIGATSGIGERMSVALANFRMDLIFGWTIVMIIGNFAIVGLIGRAERWLLRWRQEVVVR